MPAVIPTPPRGFDPGRSSAAFLKQWKHPTETFTILLLLGGDVVNRALAQLAGQYFTPVAFSFGKLHLPRFDLRDKTVVLHEQQTLTF